MGFATGIAPYVGVSRLDQPPVRKLAGDARWVAAVHDDLVIELQVLLGLGDCVEVQRPGDVSCIEAPFVHRHHQSEIITSVEFRLQLVALDRLDIGFHLAEAATGNSQQDGR